MAAPRTEQYLHGHPAVVVDAHARRTAEEAARFLLPLIEPSMSILDVGCGPGSITSGLAAAVPRGKVVGLDRSPSVLARARDHLIAVGAHNATVLAADVYDLPFAAGAFDVAYAHQVLQHLVDPVGALREIHAVVRPGGLVAVRDADYGTMTHAPRHALLDRWLELYRTVGLRLDATPDAGRHLLGWVNAAGFVDPVVTASTWTFADPAARREWAELWAGRIVGSDFASHVVRLGLSVEEELRTIAEAWRSWADDPDGFFAFVNVEVVAHRP